MKRVLAFSLSLLLLPFFGVATLAAILGVALAFLPVMIFSLILLLNGDEWGNPFEYLWEIITIFPKIWLSLALG